MVMAMMVWAHFDDGKGRVDTLVQVINRLATFAKLSGKAVEVAILKSPSNNAPRCCKLNTTSFVPNHKCLCIYYDARFAL